MEFEEAFGVAITDEEAASCLTPRTVIDVIFSKLKALERADGHVCRSQRAFYTIRRVLVQAFGLERRSITPDLRFRDWIPEPREKELWAQLAAALSPRNWPGLVRPLWMSRLLGASAFAIFGATTLAVIRLSWSDSRSLLDWIVFVLSSAWSGVMVACLFGIIAATLTRSHRIYISPDIKSIRDLIPHGITSDRMNAWTREEVATVVKRLVIEQLGLQESDYTEDSRFIEDFNMN